MTEPHPPEEHWVAQEGAFSAATSNVPVLHYYPVRGRAEPIRLVLALMQQPWFEPPVEPLHALVRRDLDSFPFRQMPRFVDEVNAKIDLVQSMAILRHLGRKYKLYGSGDLEDSAAIDMVLDAVSELREKLKNVWVVSKMEPGAVQRYTSSVLAPEAELLASKEPGPGLACLERLLAGPPGADAPAGSGMQGDDKHSSSSQPAGAATASGAAASCAACAGEVVDDGSDEGASLLSDDGAADGRLWFVGERLSIADIAVADLVDLNLVHFEAQVKSTFPHLHLHWRRVMGQTGIKAYLGSNNRHSLMWGQDWIDQRQGAADGQQ
ncbi:hypothetical protein OEZ85_013773 [Tetradesmus obliquus]|uniref:glutathione transferase n=1 Tax=Tetradesmus obliquus TaxID=3088 RepID=A0ABY8U5V9_TETOB|nr:hypothetical protein OEZ85_013773 [Tetradesmus obliquus]